MDNLKNYVITGMSGTGKTTLVDSLRGFGFQCYEEPARKILEYQIKIDGPALPAKNPTMFVQEMLAHSLRDIEEANSTKGVTVFDRGLPDVVAYAIRFGVVHKEIERIAKTVRYNHQVFLLPPWDEIFRNDEFRKASFESYIKFHELLRKSYTGLGYELVDVPKISPEARVDFILSAIDNRAT